MKIYFIRHAETKHNKAGLFMDHKTEGFSDDGFIMLKKLKKRLAKNKFDQIFSSDSRRCVETVKYLFGDNQDVKYLKILREKNNGEKNTGKSNKNFDRDSLPGTFETRRLPGGENLIEFRNRILRFWDFLKKQKKETLLVIGHGAFLKVLFGALMGKDLRGSIFDLKVDHCSITIVNLSNDKINFETVNSTLHLK